MRCSLQTAPFVAYTIGTQGREDAHVSPFPNQTPKAVIAVRIAGGSSPPARSIAGVTRDGQRFLVVTGSMLCSRQPQS